MTDNFNSAKQIIQENLTSSRSPVKKSPRERKKTDVESSEGDSLNTARRIIERNIRRAADSPREKESSVKVAEETTESTGVVDIDSVTTTDLMIDTSSPTAEEEVNTEKGISANAVKSWSLKMKASREQKK